MSDSRDRHQLVIDQSAWAVAERGRVSRVSAARDRRGHRELVECAQRFRAPLRVLDQRVAALPRLSLFLAPVLLSSEVRRTFTLLYTPMQKPANADPAMGARRGRQVLMATICRSGLAHSRCNSAWTSRTAAGRRFGWPSWRLPPKTWSSAARTLRSWVEPSSQSVTLRGRRPGRPGSRGARALVGQHSQAHEGRVRLGHRERLIQQLHARSRRRRKRSGAPVNDTLKSGVLGAVHGPPSPGRSGPGTGATPRSGSGSRYLARVVRSRVRSPRSPGPERPGATACRVEPTVTCLPATADSSEAQLVASVSSISLPRLMPPLSRSHRSRPRRGSRASRPGGA